jgi:hypothetical protein
VPRGGRGRSPSCPARNGDCPASLHKSSPDFPARKVINKRLTPQARRNSVSVISAHLHEVIHVLHGYMQKIQILFPDPIMTRLRRLARLQDRPVSEIIRRAVEESLARTQEPKKTERRIPSFRGGQIICSAEELRETLYQEDLR